jgi:hypothetical protein
MIPWLQAPFGADPGPLRRTLRDKRKYFAGQGRDRCESTTLTLWEDAARASSEEKIVRLKILLGATLLSTLFGASATFAEDINIAVVGPMTGQLATIGDQFKVGAEAAAAAINERAASWAARSTFDQR